MRLEPLFADTLFADNLYEPRPFSTDLQAHYVALPLGGRRYMDRLSIVSAGVRARDRNLRVLQGRGGRETRDRQDLLLVQGLVLQQCLGQRVELLAVLREETARLFVALIDDAEHLFVYGASGLLAEGLVARIASPSEESVLARGELDHP